MTFSSPMRTTRPSKPSLRSVSAALAPASAAPTITKMRSEVDISAPGGEGEELLPGAGIVADQAMQRGRDRAGPHLLHPAQRHARVLGFDDHADALRGQVLLEPSRHLGGETLLQLKIPREQLDHARELGDPDDALTGQVGDVGD